MPLIIWKELGNTLDVIANMEGTLKIHWMLLIIWN
jgi:hypothetical protein